MGNAESAPVHVGVEVEPPTPGNSGIRRNSQFPNELICVPYPDKPELNTPYKCFANTVERFGKRPCTGVREKLPDGKAGAFKFDTYDQVNDKVNKIGTFLASQDLKQETPVGIFSINRPEWTITALAIWRQGLAVTALYDTLGPESSAFIINDCNLPIIFAAKANMHKLVEFLDKCPDLKLIIQIDDDVDEEQKKKLTDAGKKFMTFKEVLEAGKSVTDATPSEPDNLCYLMYTSGTTGNPKGVRMTNKNLLASAAGTIRMGVDMSEEDVYLSYLPLAHSFEAMMQVGGLCVGASVGFYQGNPKLIVDDVGALRPTIFAGVPRVYSRIYDKIQQTVAEGSWLKQKIFHTAYSSQLENVRQGTRSAIWDKLVFDKIKARLGGRIRFMATGAAPMPPHLMDFLRVAFGCKVFQGYGMTENAAAAVVTPPNYLRSGTVGEPIPACEIKLCDVPELEYLSTDKPYPRGEVCIRGHNVFQGYHNLEEKTKETLDDDGWLHTGDIGQFLDDGSLQIIDRKKNIFKLSHGEYVAAEELENLFGKSKWIAQIWVYGDSNKSVLVAIITPDVETVIPWCKQNGLPTDPAEAFKRDEVRKLIMDDIKQIGRSEGTAGFKIPKAIHLEGRLDDQNMGFTVENDTMTPTFKLRRPQLKKRYENEIKQMYESLGE